jgi:hypothetical protein
MFGVCGNELSADGHVVDKQYGCGAHSDTPAPAGTGSAMYEPYDDGVLDIVEKPPVLPEPESEPEPEIQSEPQSETEAQSEGEPEPTSETEAQSETEPDSAE